MVAEIFLTEVASRQEAEVIDRKNEIGKRRALTVFPEARFRMKAQARFRNVDYRSTACEGRRSPIVRTPSSCMVRTISVRRMSADLRTPRSPPAISPYR
jgi:hypothetical protein